ncbi:unnamed protein product [Spirodela intermedia]|uniref:Uncharacterized protein n=1 Tax=Spirodela intermedia TaxID=51605 RepID=A0A7I8KTA8_SPIIN|nr:unnamed protein product [Spirodela intermedia]
MKVVTTFKSGNILNNLYEERVNIEKGTKYMKSMSKHNNLKRWWRNSTKSKSVSSPYALKSK